MGNTVEFTDANFNDEVLSADTPVIVDCWAVWCGPCRKIGPLVEELADEYAGRVKMGKLDVDNNGATAANYGIRSIPTLLFFKEGKLADTLIGAVPKKAIVEKMEALL